MSNMSRMSCSETGLSTTTTSSGLLDEARRRAQFVGAALHVGMAGLPVGRLRALLLQHRISDEQAGRFHIYHELRTLVDRRHVARQHHADLVGENLFAGIVDHAAAIAV